jgi:uncharacterized SAM-dependent methyltransferase
MTGNLITAAPQVAAPESADFLADVIAGLSSNPRIIPCKYFYDERGAALFQRICVNIMLLGPRLIFWIDIVLT